MTIDRELRTRAGARRLHVEGPPLLLLLALLAGCAGTDSRQAAAGRRLVGTWRASFTVTEPLRLTAPPPTAPVVATLAVFQGSHAGSRSAGVPRPSDYGAYDGDFSPFGFDPRVPGKVPGITASIQGDSVFLALSPESSEYAVQMRGTLAGDSIVGVWRAEARGNGTAGDFIMRRLRS